MERNTLDRIVAAAGLAVAAGLAAGQPAFTASFPLIVGDSLAGLPGPVEDIDDVVTNNNGDWLIAVDTIAPDDPDLGNPIFRDEALVYNGQVILVEGAQVPNAQGITLTQNAGQFTSVEFALDNNGNWAFITPTDEANDNSEPDWALIVNGNVALTAGDTVNFPGLGSLQELTGSTPQRVELNDNNQLVLSATLDARGAGVARFIGVFDFDPATGALSNETLVAFAGNVPTVIDGFNLADVHIVPQRELEINESGDVIWIADLDTGSSADDLAIVLYESRTGTNTVLAREGDQAAGLPAGVTYSGLQSKTVALNNRGRFAFWSVLANTPGGFNDNLALFGDLGNGLEVIAQKGITQAFDGTLTSFNTGGPLEFDNNGNFVHFADSNADPATDAGFLYNGADWIRDGVTQIDGETVTNVIAVNDDALLSDDGSKFLFIANFGSERRAVLLSIGAGDDCPADLTGGPDGGPDGTLDANDFFQYLSLFAAGDPAADIASPGSNLPDGIVDSNDFFEYLNLFAAGCP